MRTTRVARIDEDLPVIGQETSGMGQRAERRTQEADALRLGVELGMTVIGTAEYYAAGRAELVVADAIHDIRSRVFLVDMVYPRHPTLESTRRAARASLRRTGAGYFDLMLVHWPTPEFRADLMALSMMYVEGVARYIGVSNFSLPWLVRAEPTLPRDTPVAANRLPYSLLDRRIEESLMDELQASGTLVMAYGPLAHGTVVKGRRARVLGEVAARIGATPAQVALAWTVRAPGVVATPRAAAADHVRENARAGDLVLDADAVARLDDAFLATPTEYRPDLPAWRPLFRWAYGWEAMRTGRRNPPGAE